MINHPCGGTTIYENFHVIMFIIHKSVMASIANWSTPTVLEVVWITTKKNGRRAPPCFIGWSPKGECTNINFKHLQVAQNQNITLSTGNYIIQRQTPFISMNLQ